MRVPSDRRRLQAEGRDQPAASALGGGARARRRRLLVGQSCARRGHRRPAPRHSRHHRDALGCATSESRRHPQRGRRDHLLRPPNGKPRSDRGAHFRGNGCVVVPSFDDPAIVAGQGTAGLEIVEQLGRAAAAHHRSVRRRRARLGHCPGRSPSRDRHRRAGGLGRHGAFAGSRRNRAGRRRCARYSPRCAPDAEGVADHVRDFARARSNGAMGQR